MNNRTKRIKQNKTEQIIRWTEEQKIKQNEQKAERIQDNKYVTIGQYKTGLIL
jgi:hypothetical protein